MNPYRSLIEPFKEPLKEPFKLLSRDSELPSSAIASPAAKP